MTAEPRAPIRLHAKMSVARATVGFSVPLLGKEIKEHLEMQIQPRRGNRSWGLQEMDG
jgi:hypothetical protein